MSIRAFAPADLPVIVDIGNRAWKEIKKMTRDSLGDRLADRFNPEGDSVTKGREIESFAASTPENIFICEEDNRIVGFITFVLAPGGIGVIGNNAVDPECGLKGIGQQMYRAVLEHFRKNGNAFPFAKAQPRHSSTKYLIALLSKFSQKRITLYP
jgi:ribosomal protein S18 acetylase RimI-like enzyme